MNFWETYVSIEELKYPQKYKKDGIFILCDLGGKELKDPRVQALFKRSIHENLSVFLISQDFYELPKRTISANANISLIFKPNDFRDIFSLRQCKASMDMILSEFKYLTSTCWNGKDQPLTIDMTKDNFCGRYQLGINNIFVPNTCSF